MADQISGYDNINATLNNQLEVDAISTVDQVEQLRATVMDSVRTVASDGSGAISIGETDNVDISTGAGALVLDDYLQDLSTMEQAAAQLVAAENKAQKSVHSQTGQG